MMRCASCGNAWPAGFHAEEWRGSSGGAPRRSRGARRFATIIEHAAAEPEVRPAPEPARGRFLMASCVALAAFLVAMAAIVFNTSLVGAAPEDSMAGYAGLEIRLLRSAVEPVRAGRALAVEGEIANRTAGDMPVPAVRIALRSDGHEIHSWLVEPTTTRLASGRTVIFRSVLASPPAEAREVTFRLAERQGNILGAP